MTDWMVVLAAGLGTYLLRVSLIGVGQGGRLPAQFDDAATFVAPSAFAALAVTSVAATSLSNGTAIAPVMAVAVAVVVVARTGATYAAPLVGMPTLWLVTALTSSW